MKNQFTDSPRHARQRMRLVGPFAASIIGITFLASTPGLAAAESCVDNADPTRSSPVKGREIMVAAANPMAARAGCDVLKTGGSAVDAAIAVQAVLAIVEPQSSGLAGGLAITYWDNREKRVRFFEGLSGAPQRVTDGLRTLTDEDIATCGLPPDQSFSSRVEVTGRAFGIPGALRVLELAHDLFGTTEWRELFEAAIDLAENGFAMPQYLGAAISGAVRGLDRCQYPDLRDRYCDGDAPKPPGANIVNAQLAQVLREVRDGGADAFYDPEGTIAPAILDRITGDACQPAHDTTSPVAVPASVSSLVTLADFASYRARERYPLCRFVLGHTVCTSPAPTFGGLTLLYMLELMERGGIKRLVPGTLAYAHLFLEASRLAQFDRRQYVGDPDFHHVRVAGLLDDRYLQSRYELISQDSAIQQVMAGDPPGGLSLFRRRAISRGYGGYTGFDQAVGDIGAQAGDGIQENDTTSHVSIVDAAGNALSMTTTINTPFGNQMEARGMALNNVLTNFTRLDSISPGKPVNVMEPKKRPRSSVAPTLVFNTRGRLKLVVGSGGGSGIPDYVAQTISNVVVHRMDPQRAINQDHMSGQAITSNCGGVVGPRSSLEADTPIAELLTGLSDLGHPCPRTTTMQSGLTAIEVGRGGKLLGAADPRRDGVAIGE